MMSKRKEKYYLWLSSLSPSLGLPRRGHSSIPPRPHPWSFLDLSMVQGPLVGAGSLRLTLRLWLYLPTQQSLEHSLIPSRLSVKNELLARAFTTRSSSIPDPTSPDYPGPSRGDCGVE